MLEPVTRSRNRPDRHKTSAANSKCACCSEESPIAFPQRKRYEFFDTTLQESWVGEILPQTSAIVSKTCSH
jgi:hypothetical protein